MTRLPLPPDPSPEAVAAVAAMLTEAEQLAAWLAENVEMTPAQQRSLNAGTRSLARARAHQSAIASATSSRPAAPTPRPAPKVGSIQPRPRRQRRRS